MGGGELSNTGTYFVVLKNWSERKRERSYGTRCRHPLQPEAYGIQEAQIFALVPPAIPAWGFRRSATTTGRPQEPGPTEMQHAIQTLLETYRTKPQLLSLSSMYQANVPQYRLNIDRDKVQLLGLQLSDVFSTLSYYMGAAYVNDFVEFGRIYQVKIEAGGQAQKVIDDVMRLSLENSSGKMVPFSALQKRNNNWDWTRLTCIICILLLPSLVLPIRNTVREKPYRRWKNSYRNSWATISVTNGSAPIRRPKPARPRC